jgi:hypothetical protein
MGHHITGVVAKTGTCQALSLKWKGRVFCSSEQGFAFLPLDYQNLRWVKDSGGAGTLDLRHAPDWRLSFIDKRQIVRRLPFVDTRGSNAATTRAAIAMGRVARVRRDR